MNSFIKNLFQSFSQNSDQVCISVDGKNFKYSEVLYFSEQIRYQLQSVNSQNIGIYLSDDVFMYAAILAIWLEGKTYVPLHPEFPLTKNLSIIQQAKIDTVLTSVEITDNFGLENIYSNKDFNINATSPKDYDLENNAYILFTSGSTGNPKGVPITFSNLYYFSESFHTIFGKLSPEDSVLQMFELTFDLSVMSYLIPWLNGANVVGLHKKETKSLQILDLLEADEITVALMVPSILNLIFPYLDDTIRNSSLRLNLFCGEALLVKQIENWRGFIPNASIYNVYGPTENTIFCTFYEINDKIKEKNGVISIGKSLPNSEMSFINANSNEGELLLSGKLLTKFYWENESKTYETFLNINEEKFYKSGDYCLKDKEGDFFYTNRIDFQAKINGFRVEMSEIEFFANRKLRTGISLATTSKDNNGSDFLVLFITDLEIVEEELLDYLRHNLADYSIPSKVIKIEEFPHNTSGKIDRTQLKKNYNL